MRFRTHMKKSADIRADLVRSTQLLIQNHGPYTGINDILKEAKVCKASLYEHFASKDELVIAAMADATNPVFECVIEIRKDNSLDTLSALRAILCYVDGNVTSTLPGIGFVFRILPAYPDAMHPVHRAAESIIGRLRRHLANVAEECGFGDAEGFSWHVIWLLGGFAISKGACDQLTVEAGLGRALESLVGTELLVTRRQEPFTQLTL